MATLEVSKMTRQELEQEIEALKHKVYALSVNLGKLEGFVTWNGPNYAHIWSCLYRVSRKENVYPCRSDVYSVQGSLRVKPRNKNIRHAINNFVAMAASNGWLELPWETQGRAIAGSEGTLVFRDGKPTDDDPEVIITVTE